MSDSDDDLSFKTEDDISNDDGTGFNNEDVEYEKVTKVKVVKRTKHEERLKTRNRLAAEKIAYTKPDITVGQIKERKLVRQATQGVVQLFNAVRDKQQFLEKKFKVLDKGTKAEKRKALEDIQKKDSTSIF